MPELSSRNLLLLYNRLYSAYGPQHWWPAESGFEVMIGSILVQNTAWKNVEQAIQNLKQAECLSEKRLAELPDTELAELIRPSGHFNIKTKRLKNFLHTYRLMGGFEGLQSFGTNKLRQILLDINGIGPETADDILLYSFNRPVFVIDACTRRLFSRLDLIAGDEPYETLRASVEQALGADTEVYNEYHALVVRHAKEKCALGADCQHCRIEMPLIELRQTG